MLQNILRWFKKATEKMITVSSNAHKKYDHFYHKFQYWMPTLFLESIKEYVLKSNMDIFQFFGLTL